MSKKTDRIPLLELSASQVECLSLGIRNDMFSCFELHGPCSVADVAEHLSRIPEGLYHHMRKLVGEGLVRQTGTRQLQKRDEALFDVVADKSFLKPRPWDAEYLRACNKLFKSLFVSMLNDHEAAVSQFADHLDVSRYLYQRKLSFRATPEKIDELRAKLKEFDEWLLANSEEGELHEMFMAIAPHVPR